MPDTPTAPLIDDVTTPDLLNVQQVAERCNVSPHTIRRLVDRGQMPRPARLGGRVLFVRDEVTAWIKAGCPRVRTARAAASR